MRDANRPDVALAVGMAGTAGFVDAIGFMSLGGYFVSFMSGNSTRLAVNLGAINATAALLPLSIIALFVAGVTLGSLTGYRTRHHRKAAVLAVVTLLLVVSAGLAPFGTAFSSAAFAALAMGAANTVLDRDDRNTIPLTYMTGSLVKIGQGLAGQLSGRADAQWLRYLGLWVGLLIGAVLGTLAYGLLGLPALWIAAIVAGALTLWSWTQSRVSASP